MNRIPDFVQEPDDSDYPIREIIMKIGRAFCFMDGFNTDFCIRSIFCNYKTVTQNV